MCLNNVDGSSIYIDGVFDLMHAGHFNALRQAKKLGEKLVVGINSDDECFKLKGCYPIYTQNERGELMKGCKWADKIIIGTPYKVEEKLLDKLGCKFVAHGDDPVLCFDGSDPYLEPRTSGRLKIFHRTEGVSTTAVMTRIIRILGLGTEEDILPIEEMEIFSEISQKVVFGKNKPRLDKFLDGGYSPCQSLISTSRILGFAKDIAGTENSHTNENVTYIDGSFDIFHIGHLRLLESAKKLFGGRLIVGVYDDTTTRSIYGNGFPILKMMERALTLLSMRVVDDVIFGVPLKVTTTLIETYKINHVISCKFIENYIDLEHLADDNFKFANNSKEYISRLEELCYEVPRKMGIFHDISLTLDKKISTNKDIFARFREKKDLILSNINKKWIKEINFYRNKTNNPSFS